MLLNIEILRFYYYFTKEIKTLTLVLQLPKLRKS